MLSSVKNGRKTNTLSWTAGNSEEEVLSHKVDGAPENYIYNQTGCGNNHSRNETDDNYLN